MTEFTTTTPSLDTLKLLTRSVACQGEQWLERLEEL